MVRQKALGAFFKFRRWVTHSKVFINRAMSYVAILNSGMIMFLLLSKLQDYGLKVHITAWFFPIFIITLGLMILFGYLDYKLGFHREENRVVSARNPYFTEIVERLDNIEKKIGKK